MDLVWGQKTLNKNLKSNNNMQDKELSGLIDLMIQLMKKNQM